VPSLEHSREELEDLLKIIAPTDSVRFSFGGEELHIDSTRYEPGILWLGMIPKGESEEDTGPWYVGRHRKPERRVLDNLLYPEDDQ
jgi:hypothetical protein